MPPGEGNDPLMSEPGDRASVNRVFFSSKRKESLMWFDEDCDRGDWCLYGQDWAASVCGSAAAPRPRKYPEWAADEDDLILREMTREELEAEFARLWDEAYDKLRVEMPLVQYMHTWRGLLLRVELELDPELVSCDHDVADAFCAKTESAPVVPDDELAAMLKDECDKLVAEHRQEAHRHLSVGYLADDRDAYGRKTGRAVPYIHPEARPDAAFRNLGVAARNIVVARAKELGRSIVAKVEEAVKSAAAVD